MTKKKPEKITENNLVVDISLLVPNSYNPKKPFKDTPEGQREFDRIVSSLKYHGQGLPILVREVDDGKYEIMDGYHRYEALKELGYEKVEIKNFGKISREQAIKITLSIEETGVELDPILKAGLLKEMRDMQYDMEGLPYTVEEIDTQIQLLDFDMQKFEESEGPDERKLKEVECPNCHETFTI